MTLSQIRRRINALKRRFALELAIIKLRRIAEAVADATGIPINLPEPADVIERFVKAGCRLPTFGNLRHCLDRARRQGDVPHPEDIVINLLPWIDGDRYHKFLRWDLPALRALAMPSTRFRPIIEQALVRRRRVFGNGDTVRV